MGLFFFLPSGQMNIGLMDYLIKIIMAAMSEQIVLFSRKDQINARIFTNIMLFFANLWEEGGVVSDIFFLKTIISHGNIS